MGLFPMFLKLTGRRCLVVGAGRIAQGKSESLLASGAQVTVIAPEACASVRALAHEGKLTWCARPFAPGDLEGAFLVIAGTNRPEINHAIYREAAERGILCNVVDDPPYCDFYFPSVVTRGDLKIAISTAGESPAFAQRLRQELEEQLPADLGPWLASLGALRREVLDAYPAGEDRKRLLHSLAHREVCDLKTCPARLAAEQRLPEEVSL
jgi:siroheme synthase-like protein